MNRKQLIQGFPLLSCAFNGFLLAFLNWISCLWRHPPGSLLWQSPPPSNFHIGMASGPHVLVPVIPELLRAGS